MNESASDSRRRSSGRSTLGVIACPACAGPLKADSKWCPACNFTGGDSMMMFPDEPPPLMPILDAAGIFTTDDVGKIESVRDRLRYRFPQLHWRICTVSLPPNTSLPVFGFWLLNACSLYENESSEDRAGTILLLINAATGQAAVVPGYAAEPLLSDSEWKSILATMSAAWRSGKPGSAVVRFLETSRNRLDRAWSRYGARRSSRR